MSFRTRNFTTGELYNRAVPARGRWPRRRKSTPNGSQWQAKKAVFRGFLAPLATDQNYRMCEGIGKLELFKPVRLVYSTCSPLKQRPAPVSINCKKEGGLVCTILNRPYQTAVLLEDPHVARTCISTWRTRQRPPAHAGSTAMTGVHAPHTTVKVEHVQRQTKERGCSCCSSPTDI